MKDNSGCYYTCQGTFNCKETFVNKTSSETYPYTIRVYDMNQPYQSKGRSRTQNGIYTFNENKQMNCNKSVVALGRYPSNDHEIKLINYAKTFINGVVAYLINKYPSDFRTIAISKMWKHSVKITDYAKVAGSNCGGTIYLNINNKNVNGDVTRLNSILLHELAHNIDCAGKGDTGHEHGHDYLWQDTFLWLMRITHRRFNVEFDTQCETCQKFGICYKSMCESCNMINNKTTCDLPYYKIRNDE